MKFSKTNEKQLREFMALADENGCVPVTEWVSGKGRFTSPHALPPFVERFEKKQYDQTALPKKGSTERIAYGFFNQKENSRKKFVLVLDKEALFNFLFENALGKEFI